MSWTRCRRCREWTSDPMGRCDGCVQATGISRDALKRAMNPATRMDAVNAFHDLAGPRDEADR